MSNDKRLKKDGMDTMSQVLKNFNRYRYLLGELAKKNIKLKYRRSYLGILWTLIEPLLTMIVLSVVFGNLYFQSFDYITIRPTSSTTLFFN